MPYRDFDERIESLCQTRPGEILSRIVKSDAVYEALRRARASASMALKKVLESPETDALFEAYSDAVYAQEGYELNAVYKHGMYDALDMLKNQGIP